ncbi:hypothetical protein KC19_6G130600 [Ceratodon purpureus]|uniref:Uncharacterized protein n=1 Tax=Ceratodon purpureus TaxID=3225 RepID=A0A8T0HH93_CERPU|nr:hypothetical protein KC19_6G130600 [Ceratodon purpureus]
MEEPLTSRVPAAVSYGSFSETRHSHSSCSDRITTGETSCDGVPGCCYDPTIIPDTEVFYPPKHLPTAPPSTVETSLGEDGVYSHDPILDHDAEELWRFLMSNLNSPRLAVHLVGTHSETRTRMVTSTDAEGRTSTNTEDYTETVTDFSFHVDVSNHVRPQWSRIVTQPRSGTSTVRETLEEYASSKNVFKEFRVEKVVLWDYDRVAHLLTDLARSAARWGVHVRVDFPKQDWRVSAFASNRYSRAAHSTLVQVLCVLTCLWIVFLPVWAMSRKRMKNRLACEYEMAVSADEFYNRNWGKIQSAVMRQCVGEYLVSL